jgi:hypothetical protein
MGSSRHSKTSGATTPTVQKMQAYRERLRAGRIKLSMEIDEVDTTDMLIRAGLLNAGMDPERQLVAAVERTIAALCKQRA